MHLTKKEAKRYKVLMQKWENDKATVAEIGECADLRRKLFTDSKPMEMEHTENIASWASFMGSNP